jgi:hypothetical protein
VPFFEHARRLESSVILPHFGGEAVYRPDRLGDRQRVVLARRHDATRPMAHDVASGSTIRRNIALLHVCFYSALRWRAVAPTVAKIESGKDKTGLPEFI